MPSQTDPAPNTVGKQALQMGSFFDGGSTPPMGEHVINPLPNSDGMFRIVRDGDGPRDWATEEFNSLQAAFAQ